MSTTNPFETPETDLSRDGAGWSAVDESNITSLYRMSTQKLLIMSIVSLGLYNLSWFWRQWRAARDSGEDVSVFWRTVFGPLMYFDLKKRIDAQLLDAGVAEPPLYAAAPAVYLVAAVLGRVTDRIPEIPPVVDYLLIVVLTVVSAWALTRSQTAINSIFERKRSQAPSNDGFTAGSAVLGLIGVVVWLTVTGTTFGLL